MAKATITPTTPSEQLIAASQSTIEIQDSLGRSITLKKPGVLAQFRLVEALGDAAKNQVYMGMVFPLLYVAAIDGDDVNMCSTKLQVEALITRLDDEGIDAVVAGVTKNFGKADPEGDKAALKNV